MGGSFYLASLQFVVDVRINLLVHKTLSRALAYHKSSIFYCYVNVALLFLIALIPLKIFSGSLI